MMSLIGKRSDWKQSIRMAAAGTILAALAGAVWVAPASAEVVYAPEAPAAPAPPPATSPAPPFVAPPSGSSLALKRKMRVSFPSRSARIAGPGALIQVECNGSTAARCIGTLSFSAAGGTHKVPFSISKGRKQYVVVPLGDDVAAISSLRSPRAVVTARTVQSSGAAVKTTRILDLG